MKLGDSVIRVSEEQADARVAAGYKFCPKSEWKKQRGKSAGPKAEAKPEKVEKAATESLKGKARKTKGRSDDRELIIRNA